MPTSKRTLSISAGVATGLVLIASFGISGRSRSHRHPEHFLPSKSSGTYGQQAVFRPTNRPVFAAHFPIPHFARLPLGFEPNEGQADTATKFLAHGDGYSLSLRPNGARFVLRASAQAPRQAELPSAHGSALAPDKAGRLRAEAVAFEMELLGANAQPRIAATGQLPGTVNYLLGNDPAHWRAQIPTYARVEYRSVYPGIDMVYYGTQARLEYDFVIGPGANPQSIRLKYPGADGLRLARNGDLLFSVAEHETRQLAPVIYQEKMAGARTSVRGNYVLFAHNEVGFRVSGYDHQLPLIVDPALIYSTFLGGTGADSANALAIDTAGNTYIAGSTSSTDFPTTAGALQPNDPTPASNPLVSHAFVSKLNPAGTALVYSTYLGGTTAGAFFPVPQEFVTAIAIDPSGNVFLGGQTAATDFPTTPGSLQPTIPGCGPGPLFLNSCDGFVAELNSAGSALVYSTYLGGSAEEGISGLARDPNGAIYVTGTTLSTDFPTTPGALKTTFTPGGRFPLFNGFVTKIDPSQSGRAGLVYSTYLGGSDARGSTIAVDPMGEAFVTGAATSADFPVTPGAFHSTGNSTFYVAKLNAAGSALVYAATIGGQNTFLSSVFNVSNAIAIDGSGSAYIVGTTDTSDFPVTPGAFQASIPGGGSAFATKLNPSGGALVYSTFLGGTVPRGVNFDQFDTANAITVDAALNAYVTGSTRANDFPTSAVTLEPACGRNGSCLIDTVNGHDVGNAFVTELNPAGSGLVFSTFLGGSVNDQGRAIAVDGFGNVFVAGSTTSCDFTTTPGAFQTSATACDRAFVSELSVSAPGAAAALTPGSINFRPEAVGVAAPQVTAMLTNRGNANLIISSIAFNGGAEFSQGNNCPATLAPAASCTFTLGFTPMALANFTGKLSVTDNAVGSPHFANLAGQGGTPEATLSSASLTFGSQVLNSASASQPITITNGGSADLQVGSIITAGDFAQTNDCGASVATNGKCTVNVSFTPTALGARNGTVTIKDNATNSPQIVLLGGTGTDFTLSTPSASATITAGQVAKYTVNVTPSGAFTQPISLACSGAPVGATCSMNPSSITPTGATPVPVNVSVTTSARLASGSFSSRAIPAMPLMEIRVLLAALALWLLPAIALKKRMLQVQSIAAVLLLLMVNTGCGGGGPPASTGGGTPKGTYALTVTATSGTASRTTTLNLTVN
jgi:hypothetical protein